MQQDDTDMSKSEKHASSHETRVEIKPAKGRPMLTWVGKKPLRQATAYPAQLVETFNAGDRASTIGRTPSAPTDWKDWPKDMPQTGLLFHGDNKDVLAYLLANGFRGKVKLIYIDPPFDSGADYVRKVALRGATIKLESEGYTLGEQIQYTDIWTFDNYLQFMYERFLLMKELLSEDGSIFVHCDHRRVHHLRCLMDETFSPENFVNEIIWQHQIMGGAQDRRFSKAHETILWYSKGNNFHIRAQDPNVRVPYGEYVRTTMKQDDEGRWYYERRRMSRKATPEEAASKAHTRTYVDNPDAGTLVTDVWTDMLSYQEIPDNRQGQDLYPTQKTIGLLSRLISAASDPGDVVLDCFLGSGTTAAAAQKLGRRWIGADINKGAIQTTVKRMQGVIEEQTAQKGAVHELPLPGMDGEENKTTPAQLGFAVYRVNDYDLQIQHNEAFNLAVEHLGMTRSKTDGFFDGTLGRKLVKIVPFTHPVTALDLEEVKNELNARPEEERDIAVVGLGKEIAVEAWLEEWNKLRKQSNVPNKIEVIELRSDPKYGGFFTHEPAKAKVSFKKIKEGLEITINEFISPTILERLHQQNKDNPLFQPQVSDWRSMVDSVMIDADYDGKVFNITLADVPERKNDLVEGKYVVQAKKGARAAVKVTDMLGEEVLVVMKL
jgi:DNA modification methylase